MYPSYDVNAVRRDFPILAQEHHDGVPLVYLDNGASSQKPLTVIEAMSQYYTHDHANVHRGIHKLSEAATAAYEEARNKVKRWINAANRREVIFTRGTTESINLVAHTWGRVNLKAGDVIVLTVMEHHANIVPWQIIAAETGCSIRYVPILPDGTLDVAALEALLIENSVKLLAVTHCSNVLGTVNPITELAALAHANGALILVDGAQAVSHMAVDVQALDVDFYAFSGHKMLGPTGIGVLYGKRDLLEAMPPFMGGGDMIRTVTLQGSTWNDLPYKFEAGTPSIAEAVGLGAAVDYLNGLGMDAIHAHTQALTEYALDCLASIPQVMVYGYPPERGGLVAFRVEGIHAHDVAQLLDQNGVAVRAGHHCAMPLHHHLGLEATVRASFALYNTFGEVNVLCNSVRQAIETFGRKAVLHV
ncbi:MAG: aminotransferase class V-fold PLP-dependent enzyme [Phototrophicaceae bacterium]